MNRLSLFIALALLSGSAFGYLTEENIALLKSEQCQPHDQDPKYEEEVTLAYSLEFCSNLYKIRDNNFKRGWELHTWAKTLVNQLPCSCSLHTHADNLAYGTYLEVKGLLDNNTPITEAIEDFCRDVQLEFKPLAKEKGAE